MPLACQLRIGTATGSTIRNWSVLVCVHQTNSSLEPSANNQGLSTTRHKLTRRLRSAVNADLTIRRHGCTPTPAAKALERGRSLLRMASFVQRASASSIDFVATLGWHKGIRHIRDVALDSAVHPTTSVAWPQGNKVAAKEGRER